MAAIPPAGGTRAPVSENVLLITKLHLPTPRADLVPRPHVVKTLDRVPDCRLTLVSAPPGFGKTTLLAEWVGSLTPRDSYRPGSIAAAPLRVAWLSLDHGDNDPARFWAYMIRALQTVCNDLGASILAALRAFQPLHDKGIVAALINEVADLPPATPILVLVLDDYHVIENQVIHAALIYLLDNLPPQLRVVIATRADPPFPLARYRSRGQLVEIGADDLRFSTAEATLLFGHTVDVALSAADVTALTTRTEGWVAGLKLAALSLRDRSPEMVADFVRAFSGSHHYVLDYLVEEVLDRQPGEVQEFLLHTSILDRLTGSLCDAVTGDSNGQAMLERLERANLFLVPLDNERRWYRYHRLFADLLRARLHSRYMGKLAHLHTLASAWFEQAGLVADAINHALAANDHERAAHLIERHGTDLLTRGELTTLLSWISALPSELVHSRPELCINLAWAYTFAGQIAHVEPLLETATTWIDPHDTTPATRNLLGSIACIRAFVASMTGDTVQAIQMAEKADQLLSADSFVARSVIPFTLGVAHRGAGNFDQSAEAFAEVVRLGEAGGNIWTIGVGLYEVATSRRLQGRLRKAAEIFRQAQRLITARDARHFGSLAKVNIGLSEVLCEQNQLDQAADLVTSSLDQMGTWISPFDRMLAYLSLSQVRLAQGNWPAAAVALRQADELRRHQPVFPRLNSLAEIYRVRLALAQGHLQEAEAWVQAAQPGTSGPLIIRESELITLARVRIAQQTYALALDILRHLEESAHAGERTSALIEILVLQAVALQGLSRVPDALRALHEAIRLAEPEGHVRVFLQEGEPLRHLLRLGLRQWDANSETCRYAHQLWGCFDEGAARMLSARPGASGGLIEPLSGRELEVLRLIAAGLSNQEIADHLFISVRTVKKHVQNLNAKLDASGRTRAVARARDLGLL